MSCEVDRAPDLETLGELRAQHDQSPVRQRRLAELAQDHVEELIEGLRFADGLADLVVHHHLRVEPADALARRPDHGEQHAQPGVPGPAVQRAEGRRGQAQGLRGPGGDRRGRPRLLVEQRHLAEVIAGFENGQRLVCGRAVAPVRFSIRTAPEAMKYMPSPGSPSAKMVWPSANSRGSRTAARRARAASSTACSTAMRLRASGFIGASWIRGVLQVQTLAAGCTRALELLRMIGLAEGVLLRDQPGRVKSSASDFSIVHMPSRVPVWTAE